MTKINDIKYVNWQFKFNNVGSVAEGVEDINQCIATILNTPKGSDPHRPTFGSDINKYVDYPVNISKPNIVRETIDAINLWEKRIIVNSVIVNIEYEHLYIKVQWKLRNSSASGTTEVIL